MMRHFPTRGSIYQTDPKGMLYTMMQAWCKPMWGTK